MARLATGIREDKRLRQAFLERYMNPRRHIRRQIIEEAIATGELESDTDPELMIDALNAPLCFRWLQRHAALSESFAEGIFEKVMPGFQP